MVTRDFIDRFGVQAVFGRTLSRNEMREIMHAEKVEHAYRSFNDSGNWAEWSKINPNLAEILSRARHA